MATILRCPFRIVRHHDTSQYWKNHVVIPVTRGGASSSRTSVGRVFFSSEPHRRRPQPPHDDDNDNESIYDGNGAARGEWKFGRSEELLQKQKERYKIRKRLDVAIVGLPNAGKSQVLNILTDATVSAVSRKRHTTRQGFLGARTIVQDIKSKLKTGNDEQQGTQLVFVDTPGFLKLDETPNEGDNWIYTAQEAMKQVDYTLLVVDAARSMASSEYMETLAALMMQAFRSEGRHEWSESDNEMVSIPPNPAFPSKLGLVLNKVDLVEPKSQLLEKAHKLNTMAEHCLEHVLTQEYGITVEPKSTTEENTQTTSPPADASSSSQDPSDAPPPMSRGDLEDLMPMCFYTDAKKKEGTDDILKVLLLMATTTENEWPVQEHKSSNMTHLEQVEEIIREKIYRCLHRELPYAVEQSNQVFRLVDRHSNNNNKMCLIHQDLIVHTKSHAQLVRGTAGRTLARIHETAQKDLEKLFECPVNLHLNVKLDLARNR